MTCDIQYGGRVTDDMDKLVLSAMTSAWLHEQMLAPTSNFRPDVLVEELPENFPYM